MLNKDSKEYSERIIYLITFFSYEYKKANDHVWN